MKHIIVYLDVDEEQLLEISEQDNFDAAVRMELGWLAQSGMEVTSWEVEEAYEEEYPWDT